MSKKQARLLAFKEEVEGKIRNLMQEFTEGKISREQFNLLYERYNGQLGVAHEALLTNDQRLVNEVQNSVPTYAIRQATTGKAIGMAIYHHHSGELLETLGNFSIPDSVIVPKLADITHQLETNQFIETHTHETQRGIWMMFATRRKTTVIVLFLNEPAPQQVRELERLHHDFEVANERFLSQDTVQANQLAYPFLGFVQKKLKQ